MRLQQWAANGWLRPHQTTPSQIADLLAIVDRDLEDSMRDLSPDWQFGIAYNAALKLCTVLLYASGFRPEKNLAHYRTLAALPLILGNERKERPTRHGARTGSRPHWQVRGMSLAACEHPEFHPAH